MKILKAIGDVVASRDTLHIYSPVTVVGEQLTPGEYFVHWIVQRA